MLGFIAAPFIANGLLVDTVLANPITDAFRGNGAGREPSYAPWDALLQRYTRLGKDGVMRVDYQSFKASGHASLKAFLNEMQAVRPETLSRRAQFAFWANLYNAKTVDVILQHYPVKSIKNIRLGGGGLFGSGPWGAKLMEVSGQKLSLDDVEHTIMRPIFKDARVHYAVNCASISCPDLQPRSFTSNNLENMLNKGARDYINHPRGVAVQGSSLKLSSIYKWYAGDFGGARGLIPHFAKYAAPELAAVLKTNPAIVGYDYDWNLNDSL
jgi:hypothetical protein